MMPTTWTGCRMAAAALKKTAEPPGASAVSPNGVCTESSAMDPTTRRLTLHPVRRRNAEQRQAVRQHLAHGARQHQARRFLRLPQHAALVVPGVGQTRQALEEAGDAVRDRKSTRLNS